MINIHFIWIYPYADHQEFELPFVHLMALKTAHKHNPNAKIYLHSNCSITNCPDYINLRFHSYLWQPFFHTHTTVMVDYLKFKILIGYHNNRDTNIYCDINDTLTIAPFDNLVKQVMGKRKLAVPQFKHMEEARVLHFQSGFIISPPTKESLNYLRNIIHSVSHPITHKKEIEASYRRDFIELMCDLKTTNTYSYNALNHKIALPIPFDIYRKNLVANNECDILSLKTNDTVQYHFHANSGDIGNEDKLNINIINENNLDEYKNHGYVVVLKYALK